MGAARPAVIDLGPVRPWGREGGCMSCRFSDGEVSAMPCSSEAVVLYLPDADVETEKKDPDAIAVQTLALGMSTRRNAQAALPENRTSS